MDQSVRDSFYEMADDVWANESVVTVDGHEISNGVELEKSSGMEGTALPMYAVFALLYLLIGGTWMIRLQDSGMLIRTGQKNYSLVLLSIMEGLPAVFIAFIGAVPALVLQRDVPAVKMGLYFLLYLIAGLGMTFVICSLCKTFSTLIYASLACAGLTSVFSGMLYALPDWSSAWKTFELLLPGYYFMGALGGNGSFIGSFTCTAIWMLVGFIAISVRKKTG